MSASAPPRHELTPLANPARLWVVCPVYLDVESFLVLRKRLLEIVCAPGGLPGAVPRFAVVDDTAGLDPQMKDLCALEDVQVITPPFNLGHQRALVFGLRTLSPDLGDDDVVVTMDSDGEDQPEDLPRLLQALLQGPAPHNRVVLAWRTRRRESLTFKAMYLVFKTIFQALTGTIIRSGNYACFRGWVARHVLRHPHFNLCYSSSLISLNLAIQYVPCARGTRYAGQSRMGLIRLVSHGIRMLMPFLDRVASRALLGFAALGASGVALSLAILGAAVLGQPVPEVATWFSVLLLSLSFISLGNFVILFAIFAQAQGTSLANLEQGVPAVQAGPGRQPP